MYHPYFSGFCFLGDFIIEVDGQEAQAVRDVMRLCHEVGKRVEMKICRGDSKEVVNVTLITAPEREQ